MCHDEKRDINGNEPYHFLNRVKRAKNEKKTIAHVSSNCYPSGPFSAFEMFFEMHITMSLFIYYMNIFHIVTHIDKNEKKNTTHNSSSWYPLGPFFAFDTFLETRIMSSSIYNFIMHILNHIVR